MKFLHIGSINRSGGSVLNRLFDGHPQIAAYPGEWCFPKDLNIYPWVDFLNGTPIKIPSFDPKKKIDILKFHNLQEKKEQPIHRWGKEKNDTVGARKNYLQREFYRKVKTDFNYPKYINLLKQYSEGCKTLQTIYEARHKAYFEAWDNGANAGGMNLVVTHDSGGIFTHNLDKYFKEFKESFHVYPVRDVFGYIASEKTRIARRYFGSRRFPKVKMSNRFVKVFKHYDLNAIIRSWLITITRVIILQEKFGVNGRFVVYRYENLINDTEQVMREMCKITGIKFDKCLLKPTMAKKRWGGSSHQGEQKGINRGLSSYFKEVLTKDEIKEIVKQCGLIMEELSKMKKTPLDLTKIPKDILYDYNYQKRYCDDPEKWALYCAYAFTSVRRIVVRQPDFSAVVAYFYSKLIRVIHIPRLLKLNLFPGKGKQNYA
jgi:hypothetical protein